MAAVKPRRTQEQRSATTQRKLAQGAFELIRDNGFANFRVATVAKYAGVSQGGQLHHFPTKDMLTMATIEYAIDIAQARSRSSLQNYSADQDVITAIAQESRDYYFSASFDVAMDVAKSLSKDQTLRSDIARAYIGYRRDTEDGWLNVMLEQGWAESEARDLISMTTGMVRGFAIRATVEPNPKEVERLMARWIQIADQSFSGPLR